MLPDRMAAAEQVFYLQANSNQLIRLPAELC